MLDRLETMELLDSPDNPEPLDNDHLLSLDHQDLPDPLDLLEPPDQMEIWLNPDLKAHQVLPEPLDPTETLVKMDNPDPLEVPEFLEQMPLTVLVLQELAKQRLLRIPLHPMVGMLLQLLLFNLLLNKADTEEKFPVPKGELKDEK